MAVTEQLFLGAPDDDESADDDTWTVNPECPVCRGPLVETCHRESKLLGWTSDHITLRCDRCPGTVLYTSKPRLIS